jgi:hypothetical protein
VGSDVDAQNINLAVELARSERLWTEKSEKNNREDDGADGSKGKRRDGMQGSQATRNVSGKIVMVQNGPWQNSACMCVQESMSRFVSIQFKTSELTTSQHGRQMVELIS